MEREQERAARNEYQSTRERFEGYEGRIVQEWWGMSRPGGLLLTDGTPRLGSRRKRTVQTLHRWTVNVTTDFSEVDELLSRGDNLALRSSEILRGSTQRVALARLFGLASGLLQVIDATERPVFASESSDYAPEPEGSEARAARAKARLAEAKKRADDIRRHEAENQERISSAEARYVSGLRAAEAYYHKTAARSAQIDYFSGVGAGLLMVACLITLAVALAYGALTWSGIAIPATTYASLIAAVIAGALGSSTSVMWRMSTGDFVSDYEAGREHLVMIGKFRPFIGAIFGLAIYFAIEANLVSFGNDNPDFYLLTFIAFVSGFSERFAPDVFEGVEGKVRIERANDPAEFRGSVRSLHPRLI